MQLRLLYLHDQAGFPEYIPRSRNNLSAGGNVSTIGLPDTFPGARLHRDSVTVTHQFCNACRHQADTVFMDLDFAGNADLHSYLLPSARRIRRVLRVTIAFTPRGRLENGRICG